MTEISGALSPKSAKKVGMKRIFLTIVLGSLTYALYAEFEIK